MHSQQSTASRQSVSSSCGGAGTDDEGGGGESSMPEEVFKWMAHSVNEDFVSMGYLAILTKSGEQEFVNLCPLIKNCSSVLTLVKAKRRAVSNDDSSLDKAACVAGDGRSGSISGSGAAVTASLASTARRKRHGWGLFSSKNHRRSGRHHQQQQHQQQLQQQADGRSSTGSLHESMARKMRKDTERIIRRTACLDTRPLVADSELQPSPFPVGSQEHQDFAFMQSTWRSFRKLAQSRIAECAEATRRAEELQREVASLTGQVERLRLQSDDATNLSSCGGSTTGRLQRVGGFLRRAVSKERLTFGRRPKACGGETSTTSPPEAAAVGPSKRSRSCSLPGHEATRLAASPVDLEAEMSRMRLEFDRRERLLVSEREKFRQANSKLNFRVQHLSSMATVAKQNSNSGGGSGGIGAAGGKEADFQARRLERRSAALQREVTTLRQELNERVGNLAGIGAAVSRFSRAVAAAADGAEPQLADAVTAELPADPTRVPQLVESACQSALARLRQLHASRTDAQARAGMLAGCLQLVQRRLGLTRAVVDNARAMEVELDAIAARLTSAEAAPGGGSVGGRSLSVSGGGRRCTSAAAITAAVAVAPPDAGSSSGSSCVGGDHQKLELRDRIIGKLTTMLRERQEEVRRLKDVSLSCQDVSGGSFVTAATAAVSRERRMQQATESGFNAFH